MESELPFQHPRSKEQPLYFLPFNVQMQNIFATEIIAQRFPIDFSQMVLSPNVDLGIGEVQVDSENLRAQVILSMRVEFVNEPRPFEISFKLLGIFTYPQEHDSEKLHLFLRQGSLSIMLPFARELLTSLCTRLQIPPLLLPLIQLASHPAIKAEEAQ